MSNLIRYYDPDFDTLTDEEYETQVIDDWASTIDGQAATAAGGTEGGAWITLLMFVLAAVVSSMQMSNRTD